MSCEFLRGKWPWNIRNALYIQHCFLGVRASPAMSSSADMLSQMKQPILSSNLINYSWFVSLKYKSGDKIHPIALFFLIALCSESVSTHKSLVIYRSHKPLCNDYTFFYTNWKWNYRKFSNIRRTKSPNLNVPRIVLKLSLPNPMKSGVKSRMKM